MSCRVVSCLYPPSAGAGPVCWLFASEILPTTIRARGMALAAGLNRLTAAVISLSFLSFTGASAGGAFLFFALVCVLVVWFVYARVPETKGRSLEDMYNLFAAATARTSGTHTPGAGAGCTGAGVGGVCCGCCAAAAQPLVGGRGLATQLATSDEAEGSPMVGPGPYMPSPGQVA